MFLFSPDLTLFSDPDGSAVTLSLAIFDGKSFKVSFCDGANSKIDIAEVNRVLEFAFFRVYDDKFYL